MSWQCPACVGFVQLLGTGSLGLHADFSGLVLCQNNALIQPNDSSFDSSLGKRFKGCTRLIRTLDAQLSTTVQCAAIRVWTHWTDGPRGL